MSITVERLGSSFVAEVHGVDIENLSDADWTVLHRAYLENKILVIPDQDLSVHAFAALGARFGEVVRHPVAKFAHPDEPDVMMLSNDTSYGKPVGVKDAGSFWHSDRSYMQRTSNETMLYSVEIPDEGGDTYFADLEAAYEDLPDATKRRIGGLRYISHYRWTKDRDDPESRWSFMTPEERANTPPTDRPVVRIHPETGRKALFVFPGITTGVKGIVGMEEAESDALLEDLYGHLTQDKFQYRFKWGGPGTVLIWDNRCVMHKATTKQLSADKIRTLYRISTLGGVP
ncbi:MAG: TauD/TfdA family dioxygenase [Alphaproteobacteria bacterium]|nr:TauD/TfdA family dioxygenase [Alphaproteobacteria bacterium]